jgi:hypothetical protein
MMQAVIFIAALIFSSMALSCTALEQFKTYCMAVCQQDGDKKAFVDKDGCNCANPRDLGKVPFKVPRNFSGQSVIERRPWD